MMLEQKWVNVMPRKKTDLSSLKSEYKTLAAAADKRMQRLETLSTQKGFKNIKSFAYSKGIKFAERMFGSGATRFSRKVPDNKSTIRSMISDLQKFMQYKTGTKSGIKKMYKQVAATTNEKYGTDLTIDKLEDFYNSSKWKWLEGKYGSDIAITVVGEIEQNKDYIKKMLENHEQVDFQLDDRAVEQGIKAAIEKYGLDVVDLY